MHHMSYAEYDGSDLNLKFYDETYADRLIKTSVPNKEKVNKPV